MLDLERLKGVRVVADETSAHILHHLRFVNAWVRARQEAARLWQAEPGEVEAKPEWEAA